MNSNPRYWGDSISRRKDRFPPGWNPNANVGIDDETDMMEDELKSKVKALKSLSIDIGVEVRDQHNLLRGMDDEFDKSGGFLSRAMGGVKRLSIGSQNYIPLYLFFFTFLFFLLVWLLIKF